MYLQEKFKTQPAPLILREQISCPEPDSSPKVDPVYRLVFDTTNTTLSYKVGDTLGVLCENTPNTLEKVLTALRYSPNTLVYSEKDNKQLPIIQFLKDYVDLNKIPAKLSAFFPHLDPKTTLYDAIQEYSPQIPAQLFSESLAPLLPRFYSIASSPILSPTTIELLVRHVSYSGKNEQRSGVCSSYLCNQLRPGKDFARIFIQPTRHFTLAKETQGKPLVMIGAGTGIAPYKAFLEQRLSQKDPGTNVLFFGEREEKINFYYREFWNSAIKQDALKLFLAFSRDRDHKIYVQDIVKKQKDWIREAYRQEGYFFVCGRKILGIEIKRTLESILGKEVLASLAKDRRYVVDVY
ncbi:sulfite reductase flavoprotein subunit alpha [Candidatus Chlamydia sanziniae]|uniref:Sulfite reductase - NADPH flavoprotein alpha-component n=1 Tax=Candidatus Chlamydia sanziniae TaxID=1806891 RepID=A0A1A9HW67_9CHLA|nr:sulfite reductase flavoprotein subunit alpha [Candidatus Chlamydia sanziniae]ANH78343.1 Sulfite reductase - NADPH flavoprotein alpha-component [Candidatus Chlamydia sanziniae]